MDVDAPLRFGAPGNSPPPNPPELAALIGLGASLLPLPPKQGGKNPSIVWKHFIKLASIDPKKGLNASIVKINIIAMVRKMVLRACCTTWRSVRSGIFPVMISKKLCLFKLRKKGKWFKCVSGCKL